MLARSRSISYILGVVLLFTPFIAGALGSAANAMCNPGKMECSCGFFKNPQTGACDIPGNKWMCPCFDTTSGFVTTGICKFPGKCEATGTSDGKGPDQGMAKLGEMLGKLMEMMKPKDGGGGGGGSPTGGEGMCTTMQPTGDKSQSSANPMCYYYDSRLDTNPLDDPNAIDPSGGLVATPTDGAAPLDVAFAFTNGTTGCKTPTLLIDFGDGVSEQQPTHPETTCNGLTDTTEHTYTAAGQYAARLKNASTGEVRGGVNLIVGAGTESTDPLPNENTGTTGGSANTGGTSNTGATGFTSNTLSNIGSTLFNTPLNNLGNSGTVSGGANTGATGGSSYTTGGSVSTGGSNFGGGGAALNFDTPQSIVQSIIQKNLPPGAYGDVKILQNGTTIIAGVREKNSEVAGFYGTNTSSSAGGAARLCTNRPWASNFLSFIIPASFFDSICSWRGYTVGQKPVVVPPITTGTTKTTTTVKTTVGGTKSTGTTPAATTSAQETARVDIWASPAVVPLGARTSVFWNTQGVKECIETSPDGSFTHSSLKGGASTVPLTAATTFTISCITESGAPITDSVTVQMAL